MFRIREILASLCPVLGRDSGDGRTRRGARAGAEEYIDNEKYQLRAVWAAAAAAGESLRNSGASSTEYGRANPALQWLRNLRFHDGDNDAIRGGPKWDTGRATRSWWAARSIRQSAVGQHPAEHAAARVRWPRGVAGLRARVTGATLAWVSTHAVKLDRTDAGRRPDDPPAPDRRPVVQPGPLYRRGSVLDRRRGNQAASGLGETEPGAETDERSPRHETHSITQGCSPATGPPLGPRTGLGCRLPASGHHEPTSANLEPKRPAMQQGPVLGAIAETLGTTNSAGQLRIASSGVTKARIRSSWSSTWRPSPGGRRTRVRLIPDALAVFAENNNELTGRSRPADPPARVPGNESFAFEQRIISESSTGKRNSAMADRADATRLATNTPS